MEKFIPYEKLSKKEKRKLDQAKRQTWGNLNPVTRKPENSKAYNRKKTQDWKKELSNPASSFINQHLRSASMDQLQNAKWYGKINRNKARENYRGYYAYQ
jgi:hypothetical protein